MERLEKDMHRDYWMSAEQTVEYGLTGAIIESADTLT